MTWPAGLPGRHLGPDSFSFGLLGCRHNVGRQVRGAGTGDHRVRHDLSWRQRPKGDGGFGLPGPNAGESFAVMGLTDGGSFRANPCLASRVESIKAAHLWAGAYAITTYPTSAQLAEYGGTGTLLVRLARKAVEAQEMDRLETLERFQRLTLGRELKMIELKKVIESLRSLVHQDGDETGDKH